ncbi:MAG: ion transporter, partial [Bacteroidota bacterium]
MANKKKVQDPGTGTHYSYNSKRVINKDGSFNVKKTGLKFTTKNAYQSLIEMSWVKFFVVIFAFLFSINGLFAFAYTLIGIHELSGVIHTHFLDEFLHAYYFSFQTFTTVGYGTLAPMGMASNMVAVLESIIGWMCFAVVTGMLYGRFSKPTARLFYSEKAIMAPYKEGLSLQFRIANMRNSNLMEIEATVLLVTAKKGQTSRQFSPLTLERDNILFFPLNWTIVHPIDEKSPLYGITEPELHEMDAEILIRIKGFDDTFGQTVHSRYSYK